MGRFPLLVPSCGESRAEHSPEAPLPIDLHRKTHIVVLAAGDESRTNILLGAADLTTVLIAADYGIVRAIRSDQFSVQFTWALNAAIREQVAKPSQGAAAYDRQLRNLYQRFPFCRTNNFVGAGYLCVRAALTSARAICRFWTGGSQCEEFLVTQSVRAALVRRLARFVKWAF